jgi:hypothetical protein
VDKQRINIDIDRELWKKTGKAAIDLGIDKRDFVEKALLEKLRRIEEEGRKWVE